MACMMKTKTFPRTSVLLAVFFLVAASTTLSRGTVGSAFSAPSVIVVEAGQSIAQAVGRASPGDVLYVKKGFYRESMIIVNKSLSIVGESAENTIVDGGTTAQVVFQIVASNVLLENFTLQNTSADLFVQAPAVRVYGVTGVIVRNVTVRSSVVGVELRSSNFTEVLRCRISGTSSGGVLFREKSYGNVVSGNSVVNNTVGIWFADLASERNKIYHNNFENNNQQVSSFGGANSFDNGYPSGGNYWDNYVSVDLKSGVTQDQNGSDGILDHGFSFDSYPLENPVTNICVQASGREFNVQSSTNITTDGWSFSIPEKNLRFLVSSQQIATSATRVEIPKELLSCENMNGWAISLNDSNPIRLQYLSMEDSEDTYLYFTYNMVGDGEVQIIGTNAIPELSLSAVLVFLIAVTALISAVVVKGSNAKKCSRELLECWLYLQG